MMRKGKRSCLSETTGTRLPPGEKTVFVKENFDSAWRENISQGEERSLRHKKKTK